MCFIPCCKSPREVRHLLQLSSSILIFVIGLLHPIPQFVEGAPLDAAFTKDPVSLDAALQDELIEESVAPETLQGAKKRKPIQQQLGKKKKRKAHEK